MKTAFVTGGTGFVGLNLIEALRNAGWSVTALHRPSADVGELAAMGVALTPGDILDPASLARGIAKDVDAVFHVAASTNMWTPKNAEQTRINVDGTRNMVDAALAAGAKRFIHVSTMSTFGDQTEPLDEDTPQHAATSWINYEKSKWLAEQEVRSGIKKGLPGIIVTLSAVVGPRDRHSWAQLFSQIRDGKVPMAPAGGGTFNDVRAVAEGLIAAAEKGRVGEMYITPGETMSFADLIRFVAEELGVPAPKKVAPKWLMMSMARIADMISRITGKQPDMTPELAYITADWKIAKTTKAIDELGYRPRDARQAIKDSVHWLQERGLL